MKIIKQSILVELTEIENISEFKIFINIVNVLHLRRQPSHSLTRIAFVDGSLLNIKETPEEVQDLFTEALLAL